MKLSTKGKYGLRAMIDLARYSEKEPVSIGSVAARQGISERYLEQLVALLKKAGLVATKTGNDGGYHLLCDPGEVTLDQVADALDVRFVEPAWHSGSGVDCGCLVASCMAGVMDGLFDDLDRRCRERLTQLTLSDLEKQLEQAAEGKKMTHGL